ncbi:MAG: hypothetical protein OCU22_00125 [Canidatus Methanoxibalbensis ujae]|nr:hypothetical protein [Candidatus Methanoxibalbensis ujae]
MLKFLGVFHHYFSGSEGAIGANVGAIFNSEEEKVMFEIMESCSKSDLKDIESFNNGKDRKEAQQMVCNDQIDGFGRKR